MANITEDGRNKLFEDLTSLLGDGIKRFDRNIVKVFDNNGKYIGVYCFKVDTQYNGDRELVISHVVGRCSNFSSLIEKQIYRLAQQLKCKYARLHTEKENTAMRKHFEKMKFKESEIIYRRAIN